MLIRPDKVILANMCKEFDALKLTNRKILEVSSNFFSIYTYLHYTNSIKNLLVFGMFYGMNLIRYYKVWEEEWIKDELGNERKDHYATLSKVTILQAQTIDLEKKERFSWRLTSRRSLVGLRLSRSKPNRMLRLPS